MLYYLHLEWGPALALIFSIGSANTEKLFHPNDGNTYNRISTAGTSFKQVIFKN